MIKDLECQYCAEVDDDVLTDDSYQPGWGYHQECADADAAHADRIEFLPHAVALASHPLEQRSAWDIAQMMLEAQYPPNYRD